SEFDVLPLPESLDWLWMFIYCLPAAWLAVDVHRFLLRDLPDARVLVGSGNAKRVLLYALVAFAFWALVIGAVYSGVLDLPAEDSPEMENWMAQMLEGMVIVFVLAVISALLGGRLCLVLPAIALGGDVRAALRAARGNTLRLTVVIALLPVVLAFLIEVIVRGDSTILDQALVVVLGAVVMVVEVSALSLSYRELTQPAPPPTDPPA
ncbi:MAG TPA: hypothetical protein VIV63_01425, partial [Steroidobacteraceae bacterium]